MYSHIYTCTFCIPHLGVNVQEGSMLVKLQLGRAGCPVGFGRLTTSCQTCLELVRHSVFACRTWPRSWLALVETRIKADLPQGRALFIRLLGVHASTMCTKGSTEHAQAPQDLAIDVQMGVGGYPPPSTLPLKLGPSNRLHRTEDSATRYAQR